LPAGLTQWTCGGLDVGTWLTVERRITARTTHTTDVVGGRWWHWSVAVSVRVSSGRHDMIAVDASHWRPRWRHTTRATSDHAARTERHRAQEARATDIVTSTDRNRK